MSVSDRILVVGLEAEGESIDRALFEAELPLDGHRCVLVDPSVVPLLWHQLASGQPGNTDERAAGAARVADLVRRRRREATNLVHGGGTLVCILRPVGVPFRVERSTPQGSARAVLHAYSWLPEEASLARLVITASAGSEVLAVDEAHPAWKVFCAAAQPVACVVNTELPAHWHPIARDAQERLLALEVRVGQGRVLFVPLPSVKAPADLGARIQQLQMAGGATRSRPAGPEWARSIELPGQGELAQRLATLAAQIEALEKEFVDLRRRHASLQRLNGLLLARTASELAASVEECFRLLGFSVEAGAGGALKLHGDEGAALVVVATAEGAMDVEPYWDLVRQLDAGSGKATKGIIVANGYCGLPPAERGSPFPELLCRGALHRGVCLVAAEDLHAATRAILESGGDRLLAGRLRKVLLEATGRCALPPASRHEGGRHAR